MLELHNALLLEEGNGLCNRQAKYCKPSGGRKFGNTDTFFKESEMTDFSQWNSSGGASTPRTTVNQNAYYKPQFHSHPVGLYKGKGLQVTNYCPAGGHKAMQQAYGNKLEEKGS